MKLPDSNAAKLGAYAVALVVVFAAAFVLGGAVDPVAADSDSEQRSGHDGPGMRDEHGMDGHGMDGEGVATDFSFTVTDPSGKPPMAYEQTHERDLHLIAVRRDLAGFQHEAAVHTAEFTVIVSG